MAHVNVEGIHQMARTKVLSGLRLDTVQKLNVCDFREIEKGIRTLTS